MEYGLTEIQTRACLEELLLSDEDMLGLLLTEAKELAQGEVCWQLRGTHYDVRVGDMTHWRRTHLELCRT